MSMRQQVATLGRGADGGSAAAAACDGSPLLSSLTQPASHTPALLSTLQVVHVVNKRLPTSDAAGEHHISAGQKTHRTKSDVGTPSPTAMAGASGIESVVDNAAVGRVETAGGPDVGSSQTPTLTSCERASVKVGNGQRSIKKPLLALSVREKTAICRFKAQYPHCSQRQISEHFSKLWNKDICRRRVSDILIQKEKWFDVESRVKGDAHRIYRDGKFSYLEKLVFGWISEVVRSGGRVWDDDICRSAKSLAEMHNIKTFNPSNGWLAGFRRRYGLKDSDDQGAIIISVDRECMPEQPNLPESVEDFIQQRDENEICLHGNNGESYTVNIAMDHPAQGTQISVHQPQHADRDPTETQRVTSMVVDAVNKGSSSAMSSISIEGHSNVADISSNRVVHRISQKPDLSDADTGDSTFVDQEITQDGLAHSSQEHLASEVSGEANNLALDDIVKTIIYGGSYSSNQEFNSAIYQQRSTHQCYSNTTEEPGLVSAADSGPQQAQSPAGDGGVATQRRGTARARLTALLVRKVLAATKRKLDAETDMIREQKQRHYSEGRMFEEQRRRLIEEREVLLAQRRKLDAETKLYQEQQRNELIRRELLLAEVTASKINPSMGISEAIKASRNSSQPFQIHAVPQSCSASSTSLANGSYLTPTGVSKEGYVTVVSESAD